MTKSLTHAREPESKTEKRINEVLLSMATGTYGDTRGERSEQRRAWAKKWKITESAVKQYTAEAWRRLRERPELAAMVYEAVTEILNTGEDKDRLQAAKQLSAIIGLDAPKKLEVGTNPKQSWERVEQWLMNPTPELEQMLHRCGWHRREIVET